jgi:hypothetical protein
MVAPRVFIFILLDAEIYLIFGKSWSNCSARKSKPGASRYPQPIQIEAESFILNDGRPSIFAGGLPAPARTPAKQAITSACCS